MNASNILTQTQPNTQNSPASNGTQSTVAIHLTGEQVALAFIATKILAERLAPNDDERPQYEALAQIFGKAYWGGDSDE